MIQISSLLSPFTQSLQQITAETAPARTTERLAAHPLANAGTRTSAGLGRSAPAGTAAPTRVLTISLI